MECFHFKISLQSSIHFRWTILRNICVYPRSHEVGVLNNNMFHFLITHMQFCTFDTRQNKFKERNVISFFRRLVSGVLQCWHFFVNGIFSAFYIFQEMNQWNSKLFTFLKVQYWIQYFQGVDQWNFDMFSFASVANGSPLKYLSIKYLSIKYRVIFFTGTPCKSSKYNKVNLG